MLHLFQILRGLQKNVCTYGVSNKDQYKGGKIHVCTRFCISAIVEKNLIMKYELLDMDNLIVKIISSL